MTPPDERGARYQMGPRSTRGLVAGWRSGQIACVAMGLLLAVGVLRSIGGARGGVAGFLIVGAAVAVATWPIRGRSIEQWVPTAMTFTLRAVAEGRYRPWRSTRSSGRGPVTRLSLIELSDTGIGVIADAEAGTWSGVLPVGGAGFALLDDAERATRIAEWSGVLAAMARTGGGLYRLQWVTRSYPAYLDSPGPVVGSLPRSPAPEGAGVGPVPGRSPVLGDAGGGPVTGRSPAPEDAGGASYSQLVAEIAPALWTREVFVAVTVRAGPRWLPAIGGKPARGAVDTAADREERLQDETRPAFADGQPDRLGISLLAEQAPGRGRHYRAPQGPAADTGSADPSSPPTSSDSAIPSNRSDPSSPSPLRQVSRLTPLARRREATAKDREEGPSTGRHSRRRDSGGGHLLRRQLASFAERLEGAGLRCGPPLSPSQLAANLRRSFDVSPPGDVEAWPWPLGIAEGWSRLRTDATWQAVYWIAEWPRTAVGTTFMLPLLLSTGIRRTISVTMAPVAPLTAVRRAERERTSGSADAELRQRHGFVVSARARREQESRLQREAELAEGHAGYRYSGYVTVTGRDVEELEQACARVEQDAALAQLELRRLYGAQEEAFCCTLPLGRGCR